MSMATAYQSTYDPFARMYNESWGPGYCERILPILDQLLLQQLTPKAQILDLCCGTGQVVQHLINRGYQVTGFDQSEQMLQYAQINAPDGKFIQGDARSLILSSTFSGVISTNAALNHFLTIEELTTVFHNAYVALQSNGLFVFDMDMEDYYQSEHWQGFVTQGDVKDDYAWAFRGTYDPIAKTGQYNMTIFHLVHEKWQRCDRTWQLKAYSQAEIEFALQQAGFQTIHTYDAERDFSMSENVGITYFVCRK
jgi:SAM-dependent methyltransferase